MSNEEWLLKKWSFVLTLNKNMSSNDKKNNELLVMTVFLRK